MESFWSSDNIVLAKKLLKENFVGLIPHSAAFLLLICLLLYKVSQACFQQMNFFILFGYTLILLDFSFC